MWRLEVQGRWLVYGKGLGCSAVRHTGLWDHKAVTALWGSNILSLRGEQKCLAVGQKKKNQQEVRIIDVMSSKRMPLSVRM